jgi:hypothetical protein
MTFTLREERLLALIDDVLDSADNEGCTPDLTVIDADALNRLRVFVEEMRT